MSKLASRMDDVLSNKYIFPFFFLLAAPFTLIAICFAVISDRESLTRQVMRGEK